jgi:hypothetical protein
MDKDKQSKWKRWVIVFLFSSVLPGILTYWWLNAPRPFPQLTEEQFQMKMKQFNERFREYVETSKALENDEQQQNDDEPVEHSFQIGDPS